MNDRLHIEKVEGETIPERRRRIADAITELLANDDLLRAEVAGILCMDHDPSLLDYYAQQRKDPSEHGPQEPEDSIYEEC